MALFRVFLLFLFCAGTLDAAVQKKAPVRKISNKKLVVLDAGHGGLDTGAEVKFVKEKALALKTALLTKKYLHEMGYRVILTRSRDLFIPLDKRVKIANDTRSKLFVSIHYNAHKNANIKGIEVYYYRKGIKWRKLSSERLANHVLSSLISRTGAPSRGVKHGNFHVIRETVMPAILVEGGFITNPKERGYLSQQKYLEQIAKGIAEGVNKHFRS